MATKKEFVDFVMDQLSEVKNVSYRPMMGEYVVYAHGVVFGGLFDGRLLVKKVATNAKFKMKEAIPYPGAKPMLLVSDIDDREKLKTIVEATCLGLDKKKK